MPFINSCVLHRINAGLSTAILPDWKGYCDHGKRWIKRLKNDEPDRSEIERSDKNE